MAKKQAKKDSAKQSKRGAGKKSFGARFKGFFSTLLAELKRVIWPDKKKLKQSTATVLIIILIATVMIWLFDLLIGFILQASGFYPKEKATPVAAPIESAQPGGDVVPVPLPADGEVTVPSPKE